VAVKLTLEPKDGLRNHGQPLEPVWGYGVNGLPAGHDVYIRNADYPRDLWTITRTINGTVGESTGSYHSALDALEALQEEYP
jgi:hypothetical protein